VAQDGESQRSAIIVGYSLVQLAISNLGELRLQATISEITVSTAFLGVGCAAWHYVPEMEIFGL